MKKTKKNGKKKITPALSEKVQQANPFKDNWQEVLGLFVICFGVFWGLSLISFDKSDVAQLNGSGNIKNLCGPLGVQLSAITFFIFGYLSFLWPIALFSWGSRLLRAKLNQIPWRGLIGLSINCFFFAALLHTMGFEIILLEIPQTPGGMVGNFVSQWLQNKVGFGGTTIFLLFSSVATSLVTLNLGMLEAIENFKNKLTSIKINRDEKKAAKQEKVEEKRKEAVKVAKEKLAHKEELTNIKNESKKAKEAEKEIEAEEAMEDNSELKIDLSPLKGAPSKPNGKIFSTEKLVFKQDLSDNNLSDTINSKLDEFKVHGEMKGITQGPVVTTYEYEPKAGTKVAKIVALENDLARLLKSKSLRVVAPVPGKSTVGFEVPNEERKIIRFGNMVDSPQFKSRKMALPIGIGTNCFGEPIVEDLAEMPHLLVAGSTGSGKSVFINSLLASLLYRHTAKDLRLILLDPKMVELSAFSNVAHLACPVVTDVKKDGIPVLQRLVDEMEVRYKLLKELNAKNIAAYNETIKNKKKSAFKKFSGNWQSMPYVVVVIDEFADLVQSLGKEAEDLIARLAQKARAAGIHLVIATQRPSVQVVTGLIKANFPTRVAFRVISGTDSRTILDQQGAEQLLGKGDMLYLSPLGVSRVHGAWVDDHEIEKLAKLCKRPFRMRASS